MVEFEHFSLPRVKDASIAFGCELFEVKSIGNTPQTLIFSEIKRVSGIDISHETVDTILKKLGVSIQSIGDGEWQCDPPSYRPDLYREIDLIEDIIRVNGYDKIPSKGSYAGVSQPMVRDPHNGLHFLRNLLVGMGFRQCYSNSLQTESISKINGNSPLIDRAALTPAIRP